MAKSNSKQKNDAKDESDDPVGSTNSMNSSRTSEHFSQKLSAEEILESSVIPSKNHRSLRKQSSLLNSTNNDYKRRAIIAQDGLHTFGRSLAAMAEDMANRPMSLPFGDRSS